MSKNPPLPGDPTKEYVYFMRCDEWLKIGRTRNLKKRLYSVSCCNPRHVFILAWMEGGAELERSLHTRFRKYHSRHEWFRCHKKIFDYIDEHANTEHIYGPQKRRKAATLPTTEDVLEVLARFEI